MLPITFFYSQSTISAFHQRTNDTTHNEKYLRESKDTERLRYPDIQSEIGNHNTN